jgi:hypothetical protein
LKRFSIQGEEMKRSLVLVSCLVAVAAVRGDIIPSFVGTTPSGGNTVWGYQIDITSDAKITTGDFFTIYDFGPFIAGSNVQPSGWTFSSSLVGPTPSGVAPPDDPNLLNLTWTYSGPTISTSSGIGPFSVTIAGTQTQTQSSYFAAQSTRETEGTKLNNVGRIPVPAPIPEPTTLSLLALGVAGAAIRTLRRRK